MINILFHQLPQKRHPYKDHHGIYLENILIDFGLIIIFAAFLDEFVHQRINTQKYVSCMSMHFNKKTCNK